MHFHHTKLAAQKKEGKPYENRNMVVQYNVYIHYTCLQYSSHNSGLENANGGYPGHL